MIEEKEDFNRGKKLRKELEIKGKKISGIKILRKEYKDK